MAEPVSKQKSSDEIDISQIFTWIGNGIRNFGKGVVSSIAYIRELFFTNIVFFSIIIFVGIAIGVSYSQFLKKKYYKSSMILSCDYLNNRIMENSIEKLNLLAAENEKAELAQVLNVDLEVAKNIRHFDFEPFVSENDLVEMEVLKEQITNAAKEKKELTDKIISKINIENKHAFQIEVLIYNPEIVKNLEKALVNFFASNEYVKNRIQINRENLIARRNKLKRESGKLDSLKVVLYENYKTMANQSRQGSNNVILSDKTLTDPLQVYVEDLNLNRELLGIENQLYVKPDFEVIDGFAVFKEPESASTLKILVISFFVSIGFGYLLIALWKFDQHLSNISKAKKLESHPTA